MSSALLLSPRVTPEVVQSSGTRGSQLEALHLKLSSQSSLPLPGISQGPSHLLQGTGPSTPPTQDPSSLSSASKYYRFKLLPPWHQAPHTFRSQVFIHPHHERPATRTPEKQHALWKDYFQTLNPLWSKAHARQQGQYALVCKVCGLLSLRCSLGQKCPVEPAPSPASLES